MIKVRRIKDANRITRYVTPLFDVFFDDAKEEFEIDEDHVEFIVNTGSFEVVDTSKMAKEVKEEG